MAMLETASDSRETLQASMADDRDVQLEHNYNEGATKFWSIYVTEAEQHDKNLTDTWKADMDSTLIFAGLFSAVVTAFIIDGYKLLQPDPTNTTIMLLTQILTVQITSYNHNSSSIPSLPVPITSSPSITKSSAIAINILWFLSLAFSLIAALMIILVQQWVRHYLERVAHHAQPLRRSRSRHFLFYGITRWKFQKIVGYVPALLHVSLFLFLCGLCVFLFQISIPVAGPFLALVIIFVLLYSIATLTPIHDLSSPFETPLSSVLWDIYASLQNLKLRSWITSCFQHTRILTFWKTSCPSDLDLEHAGLDLEGASTPDVTLPQFPSQHFALARRNYALNPIGKYENKSLEMDAQAFVWALKRTIDDNELEKFAESIPGFLSSTDGQKTWSLVHEMFSQSSANDDSTSPLVILEIRIAALLKSIAMSGNTDAGLRRRRGMACLKALFTISIQQFIVTDLKPLIPRTAPSVFTSFIMNDMSEDTFWDDEAVTMVLCTDLLSPYRKTDLHWKGSYEEFNDYCIAADKLLHVIEDLDQVLIDVFNEAGEHLTETGKADTANLLLTYFSVLDKKSCELAACVKYVLDYVPEGHFDIYPYHLRRCLAFSMNCIKTSLEVLTASKNLLFGHQLLALMRCHRIYPSLPDRTHLIPPEDAHSWLHVDDDKVSKSDPNSPFHHLLLELQPITSLVHLIGRLTQPIHAELSGSSLSPGSWSRTSGATDPDLRPESVASFGPFQLLASDLKDTSSRLFLQLIRCLRLHARRTSFRPDASTIFTTISYLFPTYRYKPSAVFAAAVESVLTWERDSKLSQNEAPSLVFSQDVTDILIETLAEGYREEATDLRLNILSMFRRVYGIELEDVDIIISDQNSWRSAVFRILIKRRAYFSQLKEPVQGRS